LAARIDGDAAVDYGLTIVVCPTTVEEGRTTKTCAPRGLRRRSTGSETMDFFVVLAILAVWLVLQLWILPKFGVST
jgi:predicted nucleic acid-binding Zn ribbon protein